MEQTNPELETCFNEMIQGSKITEDMLKDLEDIDISVQWQIDSLMGYQKFNKGKYSYEIGGELEDFEIRCTIEDSQIGIKLLKEELLNFRLKTDGKQYRVRFIENEEDMNLYEFPIVPFEEWTDFDMFIEFSEKLEKGILFLSRIPAFNKLFVKYYDPEHSTGTPIPINVSLGTYENQMIPLIVLEHFLKKASLRYLVDCGCRIFHQCKDYDYRLGCMYLGKGVEKLDLTIPWRIEKHGHLASFEEAMEQAKKAVDSGLVPVMGRYRAEAATMYALPDEGDMLTICYCCPCCCVQSGMKYSSSTIKEVFKRMDGVTVKVDKDICVGCEAFLEVCIYDGIKINDGKAEIDQDSCLGCGRCERECPNKAISIKITDLNSVDKLIGRIESYVDVS